MDKIIAEILPEINKMCHAEQQPHHLQSADECRLGGSRDLRVVLPPESLVAAATGPTKGRGQGSRWRGSGGETGRCGA